jgi:hypothetical protein
VIVQARKILTQFIYGLVDQGEQDEQRLTVGGLAHLKAIERDHAIKSAYEASEKDGASSSPRQWQDRISHDGSGTTFDSRRSENRTQQMVRRHAGDVLFPAERTGIQILPL